MATQIKMPRQGQSVEYCIITKLYVEEGSEVKEGDLLFAYETDKASFEYESEQDGTLLKWLFSEGDEVPVLETVCIIGELADDERGFEIHAGEKHGSPDPLQRGDIPLSRHKVGTSPLKGGSHPPGPSGPSPFKGGSGISPRARKMAEEMGIDISMIKGSGPGGRIIVRDLEGAEITEKAVTTTDDSMEYSDEPLTNIRKIIARSMYQSLQNSAQLTHHLGADARKLLEAREKIKEAKGQQDFVNITINDLVCFAVIKALADHPRINSQLHGETMRLFRHVNLGIAVDTDRGLMVPVIKSADSLSIEEFSKRTADLSEQCRSGAVDPDIIRPEAGSFTVSNLGNYGVEMFTPVINLPQTAILGVNAIVPRPADLGGGVYGFIPYIGLSLTYDHRALDGAEATRFLKQVAEEIKNIEIK
ncbi:MAG: 2-oxo acid dehydrogenase subunit E2 [Bacteroidales bacterium]|nr:2-oxo acid dehydrogenase subunit E2 [Bacteroidales bacterium]